jgi:hypothetical protein
VRERARPLPPPPRLRTVAAGDAPLGGVGAMVDSGALWAARDVAALRARLSRDGYLLLRGALPPLDVCRARRAVLAALAREVPACFAPGAPPGSRAGGGAAAPGAARLGLLGRQHICALPRVAAVLESRVLFDIAASLLQVPAADVITPAFKWARAVAPGEFTGVHADTVFLGGGTSSMLTAWVPLGDVPVEQGALLVAPGSHRLRAFAALRREYLPRTLGADGTHSGWLAASAADVARMLPPGAPPPEWVTADFGAGDVAVLRLDVLHMSCRNVSAVVRTSADTRWQAADAPRDARLRYWRAADGTLV